jgi:hypothetical protein
MLYSIIVGLSLVGGFARVRDVSEPLQPFYLKCGICQLTDNEYDISMPTFIITW